MEDFIKSMNIFLEYSSDTKWPFHYEHDIMYFCAIEDLSIISDADKAELENLGWDFSDDGEEITSYRYGSC